MAAQTPPTTEECAAILGRVSSSLLGWAPLTDSARAEAHEALAVLRVLLPVPWPTPLCSEFYESPIDASEPVALVRDTLCDRLPPGDRRDLHRAAFVSLRHAMRGHIAQRRDLSVSHADVSAHDGAAVRAARGA